MTIREQIKQDITTSMKAGDKDKTLILRTVFGVIQNAEKSGNTEEIFDDVKVVALLQKEKKKRIDTANEYESYGATDRAAKERFEAEIIEAYLPEQMSEKDVLIVINDTIAEFENPTIRNMGEVMKKLTSKLAGKADARFMSDVVREKLSATPEV